MKQYYQTPANIIIDENNTIIPLQDGHPLFIEYVEFLTQEGTVLDTKYQTPDELEEIRKANIPQEITPRQFKLALALNGTTPEMIEAFINGMEEPTRTLAMINWKDATTFKRSNEMINQFAPLLGLTQEQLDNIFTLGATFE